MHRAHLPQLAIFAAVAKRQGFRSAAASLGISPSAVSHAVSELERQLGCRLFQRSTRSLGLTEVGMRLAERLEPAFAEIEAAVQDVTEADALPRGRVRVTAPPQAAIQLLGPHLLAFAEAYPAIVIDIVAEDRLADIIAEGFDAGIRLGENLQPDVIAIRIGGSQRLALVASPAYLEQHGMPAALEDLAQHRCLQHRFSSGRVYPWEFERDGGTVTLPLLPGPVTTNEYQIMIDATLAGAGIAFLFEASVASHLDAGRLVEILPAYTPAFPGFFLYYSSRKQMRPALRAFIDFFVARNRMPPETGA